MDLSDYPKLAIVFIIAAIVIGISGTILTELQKQQCAGGATWNATLGNCNPSQTTIASNATKEGLSGVTTFSTWLPTIAVISAAAIVIALISIYFRTG